MVGLFAPYLLLGLFARRPSSSLFSGGLDYSPVDICAAGGLLEAPADVWGVRRHQGNVLAVGLQQRSGRGLSHLYSLLAGWACFAAGNGKACFRFRDDVMMRFLEPRINEFVAVYLCVWRVFAFSGRLCAMVRVWAPRQT